MALEDDITRWAADGLLYELRNGVARLTLNRPKVKNAVDLPLRRALLEALDHTGINPDVHAVLMTGAGGAFSSGADLGQTDVMEMPEEYRRGEHVHMHREDGLKYGWWRLIEKVWTNPKPVVTAVLGPAYGFGANFAFSSDLVIAGESATFCEIFVRRGLPLEAGGAYILGRSISPVRAKELALFGDPLPADEAERWGLINRCVPDDEALQVATEWAERLAASPTIGLGHIKSQVNNGLDMNIQQTWREEVTFLGIGPGAHDAEEAMKSFFEKRPARFTGR